MRRSATLPVLSALASLAAACGTGEVNPGTASPTPTATPTATATPTGTPTATPTPSGPVRSVILTSAGAGLMHAGTAAIFRMKSASGLVACDWVRIDEGDPFVFTISSAGVLEQGRTYEVIELVLGGGDGNQQFNEGVDHPLSHPAVTVTTDLHLTFLHSDPAAGGWVDGGDETALPPGFSWVDGAGCPGEPQ